MTRLWLSDETLSAKDGVSTATDSAIVKFAAALKGNKKLEKELREHIAALLVELLVRIEHGYERQHLIPTLDLLISELKVIAYAHKSPSAYQRKRIAEATTGQRVAPTVPQQGVARSDV